MPELPEVEVVRTGLASLLLGRKVQSVTAFRADLRYPLPDFSPLFEQKIHAIRRRSKYLLFDFTGDTERGEFEAQTLVWHLGMTGQFHVLPKATSAGAHEHVRFDFDDGSSLRYRDARRFGYAGLMATNDWEKHAWFKRLGPEPLFDEFDVACLLAHCHGRKAPIKTLIMDAHVVVGVGNIYAAESLFLAGIHPARAAGRISKQRLQALVDAIKVTLAAAIQAGGSSISDFVQVDGKPGYFAHNFHVYGREGEDCTHCDAKIRRIIQAGRSSFYCPMCQH
ncbi:MAG: DNA-formamidopyrimidine glycosylase [Proteobacteria bacterium]|nr:bifunctional DNA-formamidopyrimidine glycosylase/DNA-(apurinic or apyrimidinic site) lyase [bacterium AH-315-G11]PCI45604.1 MAG: DNA-formamidopyrimidine glycosylase [Pseudomonadota bacterium]